MLVKLLLGFLLGPPGAACSLRKLITFHLKVGLLLFIGLVSFGEKIRRRTPPEYCSFIFSLVDSSVTVRHIVRDPAQEAHVRRRFLDDDASSHSSFSWNSIGKGPLDCQLTIKYLLQHTCTAVQQTIETFLFSLCLL